MPTEFQFRRYSAAEIATKTGKEGEIFIDTDNWILKIQDGVTAGGQSASVVANVPFSNVTGAVSTNTNLQTALDAKIDNDFATSLSTTTVGGLSGTTYLIVQDSVDTYKIDYTVLLTPYADAIATNSSLNAVSLKTSSSAEISGLDEKPTPISADVLLIEDSADSFSKKYIEIGNLPGGGGGGSGTVTSVAVSGSDGIEVDSGSPITTSGTIALGIDASTLLSHISVESGADVTDETNVKSAIDGMTLTDIGTPASTDRILIQDADDSNNLKYADFSEFGGGGSGIALTDLSALGTPGTNGDGVVTYDDSTGEFTSHPVDQSYIETQISGTTSLYNYIQSGTGSIDLSTDFASGAIVDESSTISSNDNDDSLPTSAAVKDFVDNHQSAITAITLTIDGGGSAITTGNTSKYPTVPYDGTIQSVEIAADQSGSIVVDVWKAAGAIPTNSNSITASAPPTLSSAQRATDSTLTGWTTSISAGDVLGFEVDSATTVTSVVLTIKVKKA